MKKKAKPEEQHALFASIVSYSDEAIITKTLDGIITSWNYGAEKTFGYSSAEIIGKSISLLIPIHLQNEEKEIMQKIRKGEYVNHYKTERVKKGGEVISISLSVSPIRDSLGNIVGASKISHDVTRYTKTEEKLIASEKKFRNTLDNMLEGAQMHDFNWKYTYVNDALVKSSHYSKEELLGHTVMDKYPGIEQTDLFKVMERCMHERVAERLETEFIFPNGAKAHFELSLQPVPEGVFILSIDITKRKKAEAEILNLNEELERKVIQRTAQLENNIRQLKESEEKFQKAFQASTTGITITRLSDSVYLDANDKFAQLTGYAKEELIGHTSIGAGLVLNIKKRDEILEQIRKRGSVKDFELAIQHKSGSMVEVIASVETVMLNGEKCAINMIYDITERKKMEVAIKNSHDQLEEVNKELESFSYSVSHDLRAPVRAISGYAKILEDDYAGKLGAEGAGLLRSISQNAKNMGQLIDDLLAFSRLERKEMQKKEIDMQVLTERVLEEINKSVLHKAKIKTHTLYNVKADYSLLFQVMFNIISNAVKYSSKTENPEIEIISEEKDNEIVVSVKDNGAGFDMKYYDRLFGVFQRLHTPEEFEGTGVGLAVTQRIIAKHGGRIWANGKVNEGATFNFSLPVN